MCCASAGKETQRLSTCWKSGSWTRKTHSSPPYWSVTMTTTSFAPEQRTRFAVWLPSVQTSTSLRNALYHPVTLRRCEAPFSSRPTPSWTDWCSWRLQTTRHWAKRTSCCWPRRERRLTCILWTCVSCWQSVIWTTCDATSCESWLICLKMLSMSRWRRICA